MQKTEEDNQLALNLILRHLRSHDPAITAETELELVDSQDLLDLILGVENSSGMTFDGEFDLEGRITASKLAQRFQVTP